MSPKDKIINEYIQIIEDAVLSWGYQKNSILFSEKVNITKRWLTNFKVSEINSMVTLLEKIQYKSEYIIKELIKIASQEIIAIFGEELKNVLFFPLGNSTASSGSMYLYNYRKELKLSEDNFKFENYKEYLNKDINIVFLDDMIGSGNQAIKFYKNNLINSNSKCYYISLFGYEDGVEKIRKEAKFEKVFACENITNEEMVFSSNSYVYPNEEERKNIRLICEEYGNKLYKNNPLGYDDSQSLLVFSHNTPNNTLPIIWASTENEKIIGELCWYPLFERKKITNRSSKNPITYMGTIKIDNGFISKIKQKNFKPFEFYTSKLTNNCQWYGILHNWDIKRVIQDEVKIQIIESFSKNIESKVISIIYGSGGSGKSTFLRRIAIDLANNIDFDVFWLTDIDDFYNSLLNSSFNKEKKSLIIIEDWYRFSDISNDLSKLLKTLLKFENIRIIIGDRDIENKDYIKYLYNPNLNMYHLNPKENDTLLKEIIKKVPIWQEIFGIVSKVQNYSSTSLYLILFILAKTSDEKYRNDTIDINDLINHYRIIIQSDIKLIAKENIGIASALIYWATLYKNNKILISDKDFLYLADFFNNNTDCSSYVNISDNSEISKMLHGYIYLEKTSFKIINNLNQLFFNHDILAEEGLSYATVEPLRINKIIDFKILDFAIEKFSDRTKSLLLTRRLQEKLFFRDDSHKLEYIEKLYKNNCNHYNYLRYLFNNQAYKKLHSKYASEVLEKSKQEILPSYMINICLNIVKNSEK